MKSPEERAQLIFGQRATYYTGSSTHTDPHVLARVVELAVPQRDWAVLDIATGSGHTAFALASHVASVECMNRLDTLHDESHVREYRASEWRSLLEHGGFTVEKMECYTQHRPLSSLTRGVSEDNVRKIHEILSSLTPHQRELFNLVEQDGEFHLDHCYVMIAAKKN